ncbi:replication-relaxation family protein [Cryptosporangium phraense]|nr:replication-relaxation family protein [Cryptosporangium phraense]
MGTSAGTGSVAGSRQLRHLLGVNQFFADLIGHARTHPGVRLNRWWSEQHATDVHDLAGIRPDGHGVWTADGRTVGFFLEHDNGTEPLSVVRRKLGAYTRLANGGPRYPVLFRVPSAAREANLLDALADERPTPMPVATSTHDRHPAEQSWLLAANPHHRWALHELPSDHGPVGSVLNQGRYADTEADR